ncbi:hypothetical protein HS088_TW06G00483 [Tripterygium wilfordii]|uniref:Myb/SANT-like DNA-binding domain-containing protein n=1 Tax=Tripterygium wilfordii TaxID=458696 RepID=A0A7J7DIY3_TRIWF|nr:uncharacterized protein LOC119999253 [Tripterygium wilfordii]KAF5746312.1 hypothetical protein HS088_TW06G00483 [Tripterygium wilfordii]
MASLSSSPSPSPSAITGKKPQPIPWTHQETVHLIQAYQDKWYSLKRGPLKSGQWEEVAVTIAARCGYDYSYPAKSAIQCRHKMEKLRKRYRAERQRVSLGTTSSWQYFYLMESLESGPLPISARPPALVPSFVKQEVEEDELEDEEDEDDFTRTKSGSINYISRRHTVPMKRRREEEVEEEDEEEVRDVDFGLATEIRRLSKRLIGVEKRKMEMMRETERCRMAMENRRIKMILNSNRKIVDAIARAFATEEEEIKMRSQF